MSRRGSIMLAVLVVVSISAMIGTTMLLAIAAERGSTETALRHDRLRALAWSGVQGVMAELAEQRDDLLTGARPTLTRSWVLMTDDIGRQGVVRLIVLDAMTDAVALAEPGKLDINHASVEMLAALDEIDEALAERIVAARTGQPFTSVEELLRVEGVTADLLYGPLDPPDGAGPGAIADDEALMAGDPLAQLLPAGRLIDLLTVFSFDPNVTADWVNEEHRGELRINLNLPWSERLGRALEDRFDDDAAAFLEAQFKSGQTFTSDAQLVQFILRVLAGADDKTQLYELVIPVGLDAVTMTDDAFRPGRIDLNAASARVLATVPGIDAARAEEIVRLRDSLDELRRQTPVWPLIEGVLTEDQFIEAVDHLTTRSLQWRVRIEVGFVRADGAGGMFAASDEPFAQTGGAIGDAPFEDSVVLDVVIDVGSRRARVAYLRDVSLLDASRTIAREQRSLVEELYTNPDALRAEELGAEMDDGPLSGFAIDGSGLAPGDEAMVDEQPSRTGIRRVGLANRNDPRSRSATSRDGEDQVDDLPGPAGALDMVDRRIGRWTSRSGGR